jgi:hypothetical protein
MRTRSPARGCARAQAGMADSAHHWPNRRRLMDKGGMA